MVDGLWRVKKNSANRYKNKIKTIVSIYLTLMGPCIANIFQYIFDVRGSVHRKYIPIYIWRSWVRASQIYSNTYLTFMGPCIANILQYIFEVHGSVHRKYIPIYIWSSWVRASQIYSNIYLRFMGPCIANIFQYISNKMQFYTVYLYLETALHVSGGTSNHHQEGIQLYVQHLVFVTSLLLPTATGR